MKEVSAFIEHWKRTYRPRVQISLRQHMEERAELEALIQPPRGYALIAELNELIADELRERLAEAEGERDRYRAVLVDCRRIAARNSLPGPMHIEQHEKALVAIRDLARAALNGGDDAK